MTVVISREIVTATPPGLAFDYVSDYRHVPDWIFGVTKFAPTTSQTLGLGAIFDVAASLGITLRSRVAVTEWVEGRVMAFESIKGFKNSSRWEVSEAASGGSRVAIHLAYDLPLGPAGKAVGKSIAPFVVAAVKRTVIDLQTSLDALSPAQD